jgi:hypothetical protein
MAASSRSLSARSRRQRECFRFDLDEKTPDRADAAVEIGRFGCFEIGEEAPDPRSKMSFEDLPLRLGRGGIASSTDSEVVVIASVIT